MLTIKTNSVQKAISTPNNATPKKVAPKKVTPKKVAKKSESVILKTQINDNWKLSTRSMSGLVRYAKGEGAKDLQKLIDATNEKNKSKISLQQIANVKNIVANATDRELFKNLSTEKGVFVKGEKKSLFSFWLVLLTVGRMAKK
jgi:hypothetical protein|tara:strand:- start:75 stop:506 length:432 start_codon:yes stop_codon:yes gene_type:complete